MVSQGTHPILLAINPSQSLLFRFPGQEHVAGNSKIPSVIYYDKEGKMMAAGAEADTTAVVSEAEDEGWIKTELYDSLRFFDPLHNSPLPGSNCASGPARCSST